MSSIDDAMVRQFGVTRVAGRSIMRPTSNRPAVSIPYEQVEEDLRVALHAIKRRLPSRAGKESNWFRKATVAMLTSAITLLGEARKAHKSSPRSSGRSNR